MDQGDELSLWLARGWLQSSGDKIQSLVVEDLQEQAVGGTPVSEALASLAKSKRQPGDFGMEIAGTLLAPVLVEFLKTFWASYLKTLAEDTAKAVATATTQSIKALFVSVLHKDKDGPVTADLRGGIADLVARGKLTHQEAARLLTALNGAELPKALSAET